jgi:hypothetical protein
MTDTPREPTPPRPPSHPAWLSAAERASAKEILALAIDLKRHSEGALIFGYAFNAEFGSSWRYRTLNSCMALTLQDLSDTKALGLHQIRDPQPGALPSNAATAMLANPHRRPFRTRRSPMPPATRQAARAYAAERMELLERTLAMVGKLVRQPRHRAQHSMLGQEMRTWRRLGELLNRSATAS